MPTPIQEVIQFGRDFFGPEKDGKVAIIYIGCTRFVLSLMSCICVIEACLLTIPQVVGKNLHCYASNMVNPDETCGSQFYFVQYGPVKEGTIDHLRGIILGAEYAYFRTTYWNFICFGEFIFFKQSYAETNINRSNKLLFNFSPSRNNNLLLHIIYSILSPGKGHLFREDHI